MSYESALQYTVFGLCVLFCRTLQRYIFTEVEYALGALTLQFCARLLLLATVFATILIVGALPLLKHARTLWLKRCKAMWERDPRTQELREDLKKSRRETKQQEEELAKFKEEVALYLSRVLDHCINDDGPMNTPVYILECGCLADRGLHNCRNFRNKLNQEAVVQNAHLFTDVLTSLREMERWFLSRQ